MMEKREIFPGGEAQVCLDEAGLRQRVLTWGIPMKKGLLINARGETVTERPTFRAAFERGRCLIPAEEFYEWKDRKKYAFFLGEEPLYLAGIERETEKGRRFVILTRPAAGAVAPYHHRMPVIVPERHRLSYLREPDYAEFLAAGGEEPPELLVAERGDSR